MTTIPLTLLVNEALAYSVSHYMDPRQPSQSFHDTIQKLKNVDSTVSSTESRHTAPCLDGANDVEVTLCYSQDCWCIFNEPVSVYTYMISTVTRDIHIYYSSLWIGFG